MRETVLEAGLCLSVTEGYGLSRHEVLASQHPNNSDVEQMRP